MSKKNVNWSSDEIESLLTEVNKNKGVLFGKLGGLLTQDTKNRTWEGIAQKINSVSKTTRSADACNKKWIDLKYATRKAEVQRKQELKKTGGGPCIAKPRTPYEEQILEIIGTVSVEGIPSGLDSASLDCSFEVRVQRDPEEEYSYFEEDPVSPDGPGQPESPSEPSEDRSPPPSPSLLESSELPLSGSVPTKQKRTLCSPSLPAQQGRKFPRLAARSASSCLPSKSTKTTPQFTPTLQSDKLIQIEEERLSIEKERLLIEKERLAIEKERLALEKTRRSEEQQTVWERSLIDGQAYSYNNLG